MGRNLRNAHAKLWLAALVASVCAIGPAMADEFCPPIAATVTQASPGDNYAVADAAFSIPSNTLSPSGYSFVGLAGTHTISIANSSSTTAPSGSGITINGYWSSGTDFASICYDGTSAAVIDAAYAGLAIATDAEIKVRAPGEITAETGVSLFQRGGSSDASIQTGRINAIGGIGGGNGVSITSYSSGTIDLSTGDISATGGAYGVSITSYSAGTINLSTGNIDVVGSYGIYSDRQSGGETSITTGDVHVTNANAFFLSQRGDGRTTVSTGDISSTGRDAFILRQLGDGDISVRTGEIVTNGSSDYGFEIENHGDGEMYADIGGFTGDTGGPIINRAYDFWNSVDLSGDGDIRLAIRGDVDTVGDGALVWQRNSTSGDSNISVRVDGTVDASAGWGVAVRHESIGGGDGGNGGIDVTVNTVNAGSDAVHIEKKGNGNIAATANGAISSLNAGGINVTTNGVSNVTVSTGDDVDTKDAGINVEHTGDEGDVSITTAAGKMLTATGGTGYDFYDYAPSPTQAGGSMGIRVVRDGHVGDISIVNGSDIFADYVGIHTELCGCGEGNVSIVSTGNIVVAGAPDSGGFGGINGVGIGAVSGASGNVFIDAKGDITAPDFGIYASHDGDEGNLSIVTASGSTLTAHGGNGGTSRVTGIAAFRGASGATVGDLAIQNGADIAADSAGIETQLGTLTGNLTIVSTGSIETTASSTGDNYGISAGTFAMGDLSITTSGDITAQDGAILATHFGDSGDIRIRTEAASTLTSRNGASNLLPFPGVLNGLPGAAIAALSSTLSSDSRVVIDNNADIEADGIAVFAYVCGCMSGIDLTSTGDVNATAGFVLLAEGGRVSATIGGTVVTALGSVAAIADDVALTISAGADITGAVIVGGDPDLLDPLASPLVIGASNVTVAGKLRPGTFNSSTAMLLASDENTLTLAAGFDITGAVVALGSTNSLTLGGASGSDTFDLASIDTQYVGFSHDLTKTGGSIWTLADTSSSFSGSFTADAGKLVVNSTIAGLDITLTGTGAIGGNGSFNSLTATGGILAPGNSIGTLTIGTVNVAGIVYQVETNAAGASDKVIVTGTATIDAPTSSVLAMPETGAYAKSTTYTILTAGTLNGGFGSVSSASPLFLASLTQDTNAISLTLTRNVAGAGVTPNQKATGTGLDSFTTSPPYFADLMALPSAQIPAALSAMSGDGYASLMTALITDQRYLREAVLDRLTAVRFTPEPIIVPGFASDLDLTGLDTPRVWGRAYGGLSSIAGDGNGPAINRGAGGLVAGADADLGDIHAGVVAATGASAFAIPDRNMSGTSGELSVGAYGDAEWDQFYASLGVTLTGQAISTTRTAAFAGINDTYTAQYGALTSQTFGEIGYRIETGATTLAPFAGLALVNTTTSGFTEAGTGPGALTVSASSVSAAITTFGLRLEHQFVLGDDMLVTVSGSAAWRHAFGGQGATSNAFAGGAPFTVLGAPLAADQLLVTAGADIDISEDLALGLAYSGAFGSGGSHALHATLSGHF